MGCVMIPSELGVVHLTKGEREILELLLKRLAVSREGLMVAMDYRARDGGLKNINDSFHVTLSRLRSKLGRLYITLEEYDEMYRLDSISKAKIRAMVDAE